MSSESESENVVEGTAPETVGELHDTVEDVTDALAEFPRAIKDLTDHIGRLLSEGVRLHPVEAVKQVPEAAQAVVGSAGEAAGDVAQGAGHAAATVPAAATDVLDTAQTAGKAAVKSGRRFALQKRRRRG